MTSSNYGGAPTVRTRPGVTSKASSTWSLVVFSVGGRRLAARLEDVGGVWPWREPTLVPSRTPYVGAVLRQGHDFFPVYNLAGVLKVEIEGKEPLCLVLKTDKGPMAICIDETVPSMHAPDGAEVEPAAEDSRPQIGTCRIAGEDVPIYSFRAFGEALRLDGGGR